MLKRKKILKKYGQRAGLRIEKINQCRKKLILQENLLGRNMVP